MGLSHNKVRFRKRISFLNDIIPRKSALVLLFLVQFILLLFGANGGDVISNSLSASSFISNSLSCNLGVFVVIYSALPHFATSKSIRNGKEVEDEGSTNSTTIVYSVSLSTVNQTEPSLLSSSSTPSPSSSPVENDSINSTLFSSRAIVVVDGHSEENTTTLTPSEEMEMNLDSSEELRKQKMARKEGINRLKRQMGMAAEIALIAPALQTMGCIPKFFCGMNSKPPTHESSALNDLAYLIKFAMLDDDDADLDDPIFGGNSANTRGKDGLGKDGLTRLKEDLILENMAEEELIQEDPAFLPFVWTDMEHRIKTKTKPGNKFRVEDVMDEIIIQPEQTAVGSLFTGIKSVLRIGRRRRSLDDVDNIGQGNESSQATPRSGKNLRKLTDSQLLSRRALRWQQQHKKKPFWTTPQFRQDMELAERIGKTEQDEGKCSTTFNVCPYTVHEMMDIVHGGYKKKRRKEMKQKKKPQWYVNANGPPEESSEESDDATKKPFKDKDNLITTTTEKTVWHPTDPENQIYYAIYPHKAVEEGLTTVRTTTRRPYVSARPKTVKKPHISKRPHAPKRPHSSSNDDDDDDNDDTPETVYDIGPRPMREYRKPQMGYQGHVEYENENDESSFEGKKPEHLDVMLNNKNNHQHQQIRQPPRKSWWSFGGGNKVHQRPHMQHSHQNNGQIPGRRPSHPNMNRPNQHFSQNDHGNFDGGESREESNKSGDEDESSEEQGKRKRKKNKGTSASDSVEDDNNNNSSEEKNGREEMISSTPPPPPPPQEEATPMELPIELQGGDPNIQIISIQPIQTTGGDMMPNGMPQKEEAPQPLQPFFHDEKSKQQPIALPRPKYTIQKERIRKKKRRFHNTPSPPGIYGQSQSQQNQQTAQQEQHHPLQNTPEQTKKDDKSNEASDEDEEEDDKESQENSSEEKSNKDDQSPQAPPPSQQPQPEGRPHINVILHGRPSEELNEPPKQHNQARPYPGDSGRQSPQTSASAEDDLDNSDEDNKNSNSAAAEPSSDEWSIEMAKIPQPARPPSHFRMNTSSEYTYSDEHNGHQNGPMRPINYSYFKRDEQNRPPHQGQHNGPPQHQGHHNGPPQHQGQHNGPLPHQGQQGQYQSPPPPSTTQKYSTGFLSFMFGKDKKHHNKHPIPGQRPHHQNQQQQQHSPPPNYSEEDAAEDDDDGDGDDSSEERDTSPPKLTSPEGKYEIGHLANKPPPKSIKPDFSPPQRPYRGSTSMEDSDEKRGRSTPAPPTTTRQTTVAPRPLVYSSYSNKFIIPPPATPPQRVQTSPATNPPPTEKPKKESKDSDEDDEPESDEQKASDESKENDEDNSSEEAGKDAKKETKSSLSKNSDKVKASIPVPPIANANYHSRQPVSVTSTTTQPTTTKTPTKNRDDHGGDNDGSDEKQDDSNQTKEDDSAEEDVKVSREDSDEDASSEERENKKKTPPPPRRKPEDDELEHASAQFPPQGPVVGDIAAVGQILGAQNADDNDDDYPEPYGVVDNIPAAPPLQQVGFAPSLEIVVPTKAPLKVPPGVPLHEFYQGSQTFSAPGGAPGPLGAPPAPGQPLGSVNPTSLLGLVQQAGPNNRPPAANRPSHGATPFREPSEQGQQGLQQSGTGQTSNRGPSLNNRRPGQGQSSENNRRPGQGQSSENNRRPGQGQNNQNNRKPQQGNQNQQQGNEDSEEENSSEEKKESSEEEREDNDEFDEAISNLGHKENDDDDNGRPHNDRDKPPPPPPPVFTGSKEQKHELKHKRPFFPRPITPKPPRYTRPNPGRREPILKHQLNPNQILQIHHPQQIRPPPMKEAPLHQPLQHHHHQQQYTPLVLPMRPSAAANLRPLKQHQRPSTLAQSFSVSHLLRPLMPMSRPMIKTPKPLDPKVVQWIKESYGIPDLDNMQGPNRSGLQSEDKEEKSTTTARPHSRKGEKPERKKKIKDKQSSRRKTTTVKPKNRGGSAEKRTSGEVINIVNPITPTKFTTTTTTSTNTPSTTTSTRTPPTTTTKRTPPTTTTTKSPPTTTTRKIIAPPKTTSTTTTTTTSSTTTAKLETKTSATTELSSLFRKKIIPDYITEEQEAKMAQALFDSSEEQIGEPEEEKKSSEEEKDSSEEDDEEATTKKYKTKVKTKVGVQKLIITVKSVGNKNNKTASISSSSERGKVSSGEKVSKLGKRPTKYSSMEKKKPFSSSSRESSSGEQKRKNLKSKSSEVGNRKSSSSTEHSKRKSTSSSAEIKSSLLKHLSKPLSSSAEIKRIISTLGKSNTPRPKPKPIKLPPIYGKHSIRRTG